MYAAQNRVGFGLKLGMLYCSEFEEYPYRIFLHEYEFYIIIIFGTRLHCSINMHLSHKAS